MDRIIRYQGAIVQDDRLLLRPFKILIYPQISQMDTDFSPDSRLSVKTRAICGALFLWKSLIRHRAQNTGRSYWLLPGGGIEEGEAEDGRGATADG